MRVLRQQTVRYCAYVCLLVCFGFLWFSIWFTDESDMQKTFFNGPVQMKVAHLYDKDNNFTDPELNPALRTFQCAKLAVKDETEMERAVAYLKEHGHAFTPRPDGDYLDIFDNCEQFVTNRGYFYISPSDEEKEFPVAFNILFHENVEQLERLLRAIYRPQNQYCIHIDGKTAEFVATAVRKLANCFPNVFVASKLEIVVYASYTRLTADINCMKDHIEREYRWKYLINMAASEFPILSNLQIVKILKEFNGANDIHEVFKSLDKQRFEKKHFTYIDLVAKYGYMIHTNTAKEPPPRGLTITKGNAYNVFSRKFVEFVLTNDVARELLGWSADTYTPDEHYWATLNNLYSNPFLRTPGGYKGHPDKKPFFGRYIGWNTTQHVSRCKAKHYIHNICVFSIQDFPQLTKRHEIIANKFDIQYDPIAYKCMEEWILTKSLNQTGIAGIKHSKYYKILARHSAT